MNSRGVTLIELMMGVVTAVIIGAASAALIKAGILTYSFSVSQNAALTRTRKAMQGEGSASGILPVGRGAYAIDEMNASEVEVLSSSSAVLTSYYVSEGNLIKDTDGVPGLHAESITTVEFNYYNLNASGLIVESTSAAGARLVTALVTVAGKTNKHKDHKLFSGTTLRNMP